MVTSSWVRPGGDLANHCEHKVTFGCSPKKLASTLGKSQEKGKELYEAFWNANPALKELRAKVGKHWETKGASKYLPGIDGRMLCTRSKHSLLNVLFQSCLAIVMDYALAIMDDKLGDVYLDKQGLPHYKYKGFIVRRVCYYHDEAAYECQEGIAEEVSKMLAEAITEASKQLGLRVPIQGEGKVGKNWKEVH